jgi:hypothetical protein
MNTAFDIFNHQKYRKLIINVFIHLLSTFYIFQEKGDKFMSNIFKFHRRTNGVGVAPPWEYTLAGGSNVNITAAQLTTWGMPAGTKNITITNTGNIISTILGSPALTFASDLTGTTITFINSAGCFVAGRGGNGTRTSDNNVGSTGILTQVPIAITNNGIIAGGGGGGGTATYGGGGGGAGGGCAVYSAGSYGGGGGGGCGGGTGAAGGAWGAAGAGGNGSASLSGAGGNGGVGSSAANWGSSKPGGAGGAVMGGGGGGGAKAAGSAGGSNGGAGTGVATTDGFQGGGGGSFGAAGGRAGLAGINFSELGGAGGAAVSGNSNITWLATGTRYGAVA